MNLDFNKVWASDTSPDYPTDTQTKRGLSYLGTEPPTFDLHDAIFQRLDKKDQWLYDQVRLTCERFGQSVAESVAGASRDTMANAITNALLTQRKADEGGYGIVKMANADQTNAGQEYNLAVSPKHLSEYVSSHNTWGNISDKPQTATRWPYYSEVQNTPIFGAAAWKDFVDTADIWSINYGGTAASSTGCLAAVRDYAKSIADSLKKIATTGDINDTTNSLPWERLSGRPNFSKVSTSGDINDTTGILQKSSGGTGRGDGNLDAKALLITSSSGYGGVRFDGDGVNGGDSNKIVGGYDDGTNIDSMSNINIDSWGGVGVRDSNNGFKTTLKIDARTGTIRSRGDLRLKTGDKSVISEDGALSLVAKGITMAITNGMVRFIAPDGGDMFRIEESGEVFVRGTLSGGGLRPIAFNEDISNTTGSLPYDRVSGRPQLGDASKRDVWDTLDPSTIPFDGNLVPTSSTVASLRDAFNSYISRTKQFGAVDSIAMCLKVTGSSDVVPGEIVGGESIKPCNAAGHVVSGANYTMTGRWMALSSSYPSSESDLSNRTAIYIRVA